MVVLFINSSCGVVNLEDNSSHRLTMEEHRNIYFPFLNDISESNILSYDYTYDLNKRHSSSSVAKIVLSNVKGEELFKKSFSEISYVSNPECCELYFDLLMGDARSWVSVTKPTKLPPWFNPNKGENVFFIENVSEKNSEDLCNNFQDNRRYWYYPSENTIFMVAWAVKEQGHLEKIKN